MPEKIKTLYGSLVEEGYDLPNYDQFLKDMSDDKNRNKFHASLIEEGYDLPDYETFSIDMGFGQKKKGFQTDLGSAYETTSGGSYPKYQGMRLAGSTPTTKKVAKQPSSPSNVDKGTFQQTKEKLSKESPIVKMRAYEGALNIVNQRFNQNLELFNQAKQAGDEQAMAELQPLLQIDSVKAEGLKKGIDASKNEAKLQEDDTFGNNINIGVYQAFGTLLQSPQGLTKATLTPIMEYGFSLNPTQREVMFRTLAKMDPNMMASETLAEFGGETTKFAEDRKQMANLNRGYGGSSYEALLKGDVKSAISYAAKDFANSLPSSATYASGVGAGLMSAGMVGDEMRRTEEETGQAIDSKGILASSAKAGLEVVTERMFGDGKAAIDLIKNLGKEGAEQAISNAVKEIAKKGLGRKIAEQAGEEVVGESLNQIGANAADIYINGKKDVGLFDGVGDAALIALVGGSTYGGGLTTANHYLDKAKYNKAQEMKQEAADLADKAMDQPNEVAAKALEEKSAEIQAQAEQIEQEESERAINVSTETMDAIVAKEKEGEEIEAALETAAPEVVPILEEKLEQIEKEREALVEQATLEADEAIKALESVKEPEIEIKDETITEKEDVQPMLEQPQANRDESKAGEESTQLRTDEVQEEVVEANQIANPNEIKEEANVSELELNKEEANTELNGDKIREKLQEIEKEPVRINITQDENGNMEQTSQEVIDNIKSELDKTGLPYSDVISNEKGSTYYVVTNDGQQHEILKVLQSGGKLVPTNLTKAKWINHLIKTEKDSVVKAVEELLTNKQQEDAVKTGKESESNIREYQGTDGQQQGKQEDRTNQEEPISQSEIEAGNRNQSEQSRDVKEIFQDVDANTYKGNKFKEYEAEMKAKHGDKYAEAKKITKNFNEIIDKFEKEMPEIFRKVCP